MYVPRMAVLFISLRTSLLVVCSRRGGRARVPKAGERGQPVPSLNGVRRGDAKRLAKSQGVPGRPAAPLIHCIWSAGRKRGSLRCHKIRKCNPQSPQMQSAPEPSVRVTDGRSTAAARIADNAIARVHRQKQPRFRGRRRDHTRRGRPSSNGCQVPGARRVRSNDTTLKSRVPVPRLPSGWEADA